MNDEVTKYSLSQSIRLYKLDSSVALFDEKYSNTHILDSSIESLLEVLIHDSLSLDELLKRFSDSALKFYGAKELKTLLDELLNSKILVNHHKTS
jgi:hypothetical protein